MKPCFPGPVPWPHCQHRCAFWWRPADLCAKPRQQSLSLEQGPAEKCAFWAGPRGSPCAQLPRGPWRGDAAGGSACENQTWGDYQPVTALHPTLRPPPSPESSQPGHREGSHVVENLNIFIPLSLPSPSLCVLGEQKLI